MVRKPWHPLPRITTARHSQSQVELPLHPWARHHRLPQISFSPSPTCRSLAKDWQWSAPRAAEDPQGSQGWWLLLLLAEPCVGAQAGGARCHLTAPVGSGPAGVPAVPLLGQVHLSPPSSARSRSRGSHFSVARGRVPVALGSSIPMRARGRALEPCPSGFPLPPPLLRVPELSLCLLRPLGLCSLPAVLLYIPKIM